jgi:hypothetical protein
MGMPERVCQIWDAVQKIDTTAEKTEPRELNIDDEPVQNPKIFDL